MTGQLIGTADQFVARRAECDAALREILVRGEAPATIKRLRGWIGEELTSIVLTSARLQNKAIAKLGPPSTENHDVPRHWWVTDRSLQQATPWQVAKHKSSWFRANDIADLCCGIGGDAIWFSRHATVTAIDRDPLIAAMAQANLAEANDAATVRVLCQNAQAFTVPDGTELHIDPDRRSGGRRSSAPQRYEPSWSDVMKLVGTAPAVIKLAPMAVLGTEALPNPYHRCWISLQRTVREQSLLCNELAERHGLPAGGRSAVAISADAIATTFAPDTERSNAVELATSPAKYLIDPDPAIRAAELTEDFAERHGCRLIGGPSGFITADHWTSDADPTSSMAIVGSVVWWGACDLKKIRKELRHRNAYAKTAKVRGTDHDPAKILPPLRRTGEQPLSLWIGRSDERVYAALTESVAR